MTVEEQIKRAKSLREALLILARAIDEVRLTQQVSDPWASWGAEAALTMDQHELQAPRESRVVERAVDSAEPEGTPIKDISDDDVKAWISRNYGRYPEDDAEGRALIAQVRQDLLSAPNVRVVEDLFRQTTEGIIESDIDWSPLSEAHREARYKFAKDVLNLEVALGDHPNDGDWAADYASGGPMWFYIPNRDLVMQYPEQVRAQMVEDVRVTSHERSKQEFADKLTHEFGADVLKKPMSTDLGGGAPRPLGLDEHQI